MQFKSFEEMFVCFEKLIHQRFFYMKLYLKYPQR